MDQPLDSSPRSGDAPAVVTTQAELSHIASQIPLHNPHHRASSTKETRRNAGSTRILSDQACGPHRQTEPGIAAQDAGPRLAIDEKLMIPFESLINRHRTKRAAPAKQASAKE